MWTRQELKEKAKQFYGNNIFNSVIVSLVLSFVTSNGSSGRSSSDLENSDIVLDGRFWLVAFIVFIAIVALKILVGYLLEFGCQYYYVKGVKQDVHIRDILRGFKSNSKGNIISTLLIRDIFIILWSLLLIIPGIVKSYAYRMTPYILAENPDMSAHDALDLSQSLTDGHKSEMFVLDLSFLGWYLLGLLALGVGAIFVRPYHDATFAQLYYTLKGKDDFAENDYDFYESY